MVDTTTAISPGGRVLVVDDEPDILSMLTRLLEHSGFQVATANDGQEALALVRENDFDVILSDITMPQMDGITLLRTVRERDLDVPIVLMTGQPAVESAIAAVEYGALRYLSKPVHLDAVLQVIGNAVRLGRMARLKRQALELLGTEGKHLGDRASLEATFDSALTKLWMAYQPILSSATLDVFAHEALVRTDEPAMRSPMDFLDAAERLGRVHELGRAIRDAVARTMLEQPGCGDVFVNLHPRDLLDPTLASPTSLLSRVANRVVLEVTERSSLEEVRDVQKRINALRELGYRIALDDLGAGYAGLSCFAQLEPDIVKLDMSLVRNVHLEPTKLSLVRSMAQLCRELRMLVVAEGIETREEHEAVVAAGCDLLQGYLFAKPGKAFPPIARGFAPPRS